MPTAHERSAAARLRKAWSAAASALAALASALAARAAVAAYGAARLWQAVKEVPARLRALRRARRERRRREAAFEEHRRRAEELLFQHMIGGRTAGEGALGAAVRQELRQVAQRMSRTSPSVAGPGAGLALRPEIVEYTAPERAPQNTQTSTTTGPDVFDEVDLKHFSATRPAPESARRRRVDELMRAGLYGPATSIAKPRQATVQLTQEEAQLRLQRDAVLPPKPYKSDVRTVDTTVYGFWDSNPNADEIVQLAARMPIVHNQIREIIQHLITSRPSIQGPPRLVKPVKRWFEVEMEMATEHERGLDRFVADLVKQLLYYGSALIVKQRTISPQLDPITDPLRNIKRAPLWGYAIPDMSTIEVFIDSKGRPVKWRQKPTLFPDGEAKEYNNRDVFLARLPTQNSSLYFWTPSFVMPALYAVSVLKELHRIIESHTETIVDIRYYARVGDSSYMDGRVSPANIERVGQIINQTSRGGTPIFPWYVELEKLELDEYVEQLTAAAAFWEQEVRRGVGGSLLQDGIGDSATRNTSDALTEKEMRAAQALVPEIQRAFRWLIMDKLWEAGVQPDQINSHDDMPALVFEEIDMTQQIRRETHYLQLFQSEGLTHGEFRRSIGRDEDPERRDLYLSEITLEQEKEMLAAQEEEARKTLRVQEGEARKTIEAQTAHQQACLECDKEKHKLKEREHAMQKEKLALRSKAAQERLAAEREQIELERKRTAVRRKLEAEKRRTQSQMQPHGEPRPKRARDSAEEGDT